VRVYTEVDGSSITVTVPVVDRSGWTTSAAVVAKQILNIVLTDVGDLTTVDTVKTSLFHACLIHTVCS